MKLRRVVLAAIVFFLFVCVMLNIIVDRASRDRDLNDEEFQKGEVRK